eukprot:scaffold65993_cov82-Phaeocystis_antarctica.AAC.4
MLSHSRCSSCSCTASWRHASVRAAAPASPASSRCQCTVTACTLNLFPPERVTLSTSTSRCRTTARGVAPARCV